MKHGLRHGSTNFNERKKAARPSMIILHYTGMATAKAAIERLCDPESKVSAHYVVEEDGRLIPLVGEECRAWHAGVSCWEGERDINSHSIGIEIVNPGHEHGYRAFPDKQIEGVIELCQGLIDKYKIRSYHVLAHSDIAPGRKEDPGELFPWEHLSNHFVGLWPGARELDFKAAEKLHKDPKVFHDHLIQYGYDKEAPVEKLIVAFHRHFYPEKFKKGEKPETPDLLSAAKLLALVRLKKIVKT